MSLSPCVRLKMTSGASATRFPPTWGKQWLLLGMDCPHRGVSCRNLFGCGGDRERAVVGPIS